MALPGSPQGLSKAVAHSGSLDEVEALWDPNLVGYGMCGVGAGPSGPFSLDLTPSL